MVCSNNPRELPRSWLVAALALYVTLVGCSTVGWSDRPAAVVDRTAPPAGVGGVPRYPEGGGLGASPADAPAPGVPEVAAYRPPAMPTYRRPTQNRAVGTLMRQADEALELGQPASAAATLERALRIAPDDAELWSRLAEVRLAEGQYDKVLPLAAKSNSLAAPQDSQLRARNWDLIAAAKRGLGDVPGAREAAERAAGARP